MTMDVEICAVGEARWEGSLVSVLILETGILFPWWPVSNGRVWSQREVVFAPRELKGLATKNKTRPYVPRSHRKLFNMAVDFEMLKFSVWNY